MSHLTGLLNEAEKAKERLKISIVEGDYDLMCAIEKSQVELSNRIYFAQTKEYREQLDALESSRAFGLSMKREIQSELTAAAEVVADIHKKLVGAQRAWEEIKLRAYFNDTQTEIERKDIKELKKRLEAHINSKLGGNTDDFIN